MRELYSLVDYGRSDQLIDPIFGSVVSGRRYYWTSTTLLEMADDAWMIGFEESTGILDTGKVAETWDIEYILQFVRAVRGGL